MESVRPMLGTMFIALADASGDEVLERACETITRAVDSGVTKPEGIRPRASIGVIPQLGLEPLLVLDPVVINHVGQRPEDVETVLHPRRQLRVDLFVDRWLSEAMIERVQHVHAVTSLAKRLMRPIRCSSREGFHGRSTLISVPRVCRFSPLHASSIATISLIVRSLTTFLICSRSTLFYSPLM
jgi:hypothetical protein